MRKKNAGLLSCHLQRVSGSWLDIKNEKYEALMSSST